MSDLVPIATIADLVARRDRVVGAMVEAHHAWGRALDDLNESAKLGLSAKLRGVDGRDVWLGHQADKVVDAITHSVDANMWRDLVEKSGLMSMMDTQAKGEWEKSLMKPPPFTVENAKATLRSLYGDRGLIFERGVVNVFRSLSWDYKSNSPVQFGRRMVMRGLTWSYGRGHRGLCPTGCNRLDDLLRTMAVLAGHGEPTNDRRCFSQLNAQGWPDRSKDAIVAVTGVANPTVLFDVRAFKNGNVHVLFRRHDLVEKMNLIVAKHHPGALPPARETA